MRAVVFVVALGLVASGIAYAAIPDSAGTKAGSGFHYKVVTQTRSGKQFVLLRTLTAACPSGTVVLGGGGKYGPRRNLVTTSAAAEYQVVDSYPDGTTGWTAVFYQQAITVVGYRAEVYAVCAKLT